MKMNKYSGAESKYLKATDLQGKRPTVEIESCTLLEFETDEGKTEKPALKLVGKEKEVVCNATTVGELIHAFGEDSDDWVGKKITLSTKYYKSFDREGIVITAVRDSNFEDDAIPF